MLAYLSPLVNEIFYQIIEFFYRVERFRRGALAKKICKQKAAKVSIIDL